MAIVEEKRTQTSDLPKKGQTLAPNIDIFTLPIIPPSLLWVRKTRGCGYHPCLRQNVQHTLKAGPLSRVRLV